MQTQQTYRPEKLPGHSRNGPQLTVGLIAQLVEHRTGIAEVMYSNPLQAHFF